MSRLRQPVEDGRCRHEMLPGQCTYADCRLDGTTLELNSGPGGVRPAPVEVVTQITAQWRGECSNCGDEFPAGSTIGVHIAESAGRCGRGRYVCEGCCA